MCDRTSTSRRTPAVFFAAAFGGLRIGIITALVGGLLGVIVIFSDVFADRSRFTLLTLYWCVCALTIWASSTIARC